MSEMPSSAPTHSRLALIVGGTILFGVYAPVAWCCTGFASTSFGQTHTQQETLGYAVFVYMLVWAPLGALVGGLVSGLGDRARTFRRWAITAAVIEALAVAFCAAMVLSMRR